MDIFLFYRGNESHIVQVPIKYVAHLLSHTKFESGFQMEPVPNLQVSPNHIDECFELCDIRIVRIETFNRSTPSYSLDVYVKDEKYSFQHFEMNYFAPASINLQLEDFINVEDIPLLELDEEDFTEVNACVYCCNGKYLVESGNDPTDPDMVECDEHLHPFGYSPF